MSSTAKAHFERDGDWLLVRVSGAADSAWFSRLVETIADAVDQAPAGAVLLDGRELAGAFSDLDRLGFGLALARRWKAIPFAIVGPVALVDPRRFGEFVARNRGVNCRVFTDLDEAQRWLLTQSPRPPSPSP